MPQCLYARLPSWCAAACGARLRCPSVGDAVRRFAGAVVQSRSDVRVDVACSAGGVDYSVGYVAVGQLDCPAACDVAGPGCLAEYDAVA